MTVSIGAALTRGGHAAPAQLAPGHAARAPSGDRVVDLLRSLSRLTSAAQVNDFLRLLHGHLSQLAGGPLDDRETQLIHQMAEDRRIELREARERRLPPTQSYFPTRPKSQQSRTEAASGKRDPVRWARKQRLGGLAALPPIADYNGFTEGERAVLYIIAADMRAYGACRCTTQEIADRAGVGRTTARNAVRKARQLGMVKVDHRPQWRGNWLSNIITIVCKTWLSWLRRFRPNLGFRFKGVKKPRPTDTSGLNINTGLDFKQQDRSSNHKWKRQKEWP